MPTYVDRDKSDGRRAPHPPARLCICPMDLTTRDGTVGKAYNVENSWPI